MLTALEMFRGSHLIASLSVVLAVVRGGRVMVLPCFRRPNCRYLSIRSWHWAKGDLIPASSSYLFI
jgi:hypothetical protein